MIKAFTFVKRQQGLTREEFFQAWCDHTHDWDLKDHPDCTVNRLVLTEGDSPYDGFAETHWPSMESLQEAATFYGTDEGKLHWGNLQTFMDIDNSPTVVATHEADVGPVIRMVTAPGAAV